MPRAVDLPLDAIELAQDDTVLNVTVVAPPLNVVTTEFIRDLDGLTAAVDTDGTPNGHYTNARRHHAAAKQANGPAQCTWEHEGV